MHACGQHHSTHLPCDAVLVIIKTITITLRTRFSMEVTSWLGGRTLVVDATELGNDMRELNHYQDLMTPDPDRVPNAKFIGR